MPTMPSVHRFPGLWSHVSGLGPETTSVKTRVSCRASVAGMLLLPWRDTPEERQEWATRGEKLHEFLMQFLSPVAESVAGGVALDSPALAEALPEAFKVVAATVEQVGGESVRSKKLLVQALQGFLPVALHCIQGASMPPETVNAMMEWYLVALRHLAPQLGTEFTEHALRALVSTFVSDRMPALLADRSATSTRSAVTKTLQLLAQVVREPRSAFKVFLPDIVQLSLSTLVPMLPQLAALEIEGSLFEVLHAVMQDNWRYFYPGKVTISSASGVPVELENGDEFLAILHAIVSVLGESDIHLFKTNLGLIEELNSRYKLYGRDAFRQHLLPAVVHTLLAVLLGRSHELLRDAILVALYNLAAVDFAIFVGQFVPGFVADAQGGGEVDQACIAQQLGSELDMPTFTVNLEVFMSDLALALTKAAGGM